MAAYYKNHDLQEDLEIIIQPLLNPTPQSDELQTDRPVFNILLHHDKEHSYDYIVEMLTNLFGYTASTAFEMACKLELAGKVVVFTGYRDQAEFKRHQIINYGPDWRLANSNGSMNATVIAAQPDVDFSMN
ncbi:MAG: hypothetical protein D6677_12890 [Calditrichaeota bacterium]|nr:MAG: hypothetical protein D6677_12890 [Calditrichota bacterium]